MPFGKKSIAAITAVSLIAVPVTTYAAPVVGEQVSRISAQLENENELEGNNALLLAALAAAAAAVAVIVISGNDDEEPEVPEEDPPTSPG